MKKWLTLLSCMILLMIASGCTDTAEADSPEAAIHGFYKNFAAGHDEQAADYVRKKRFDGMTPLEFVNHLRNQHFRIKNYSIGEIVDFNDSVKIATIFEEKEHLNMPESGNALLYLFLEDGKWVIDFNYMIDAADLSEKSYTDDENRMKLELAHWVESIEGIDIYGKLYNLNQENKVIFSGSEKTVATLRTSDGAFSHEFSASGIEELGHDLLMEFFNATGTVEELTIEGIVIQDKNNQRAPETISLTIPLR